VIASRPCSRITSNARLGLESCHEAGRAQHPQAVFAEALGRIAHGAQDPGLEIGQAVEGIDQPVIEHVVGDGVDREVAAGEIGHDVVHEVDAVGAAPVAVTCLTPQGGDLVAVLTEHDRHRAVLDPGRDHTREQRHHLLGLRAGRDVPVGVRRRRRSQVAEQLVAHRAADCPAAEAGFVQALAQLLDIAWDRAGEAFGGDGHGGFDPPQSNSVPGIDDLAAADRGGRDQATSPEPAAECSAEALGGDGDIRIRLLEQDQRRPKNR
jgi:hypothetical protein